MRISRSGLLKGASGAAVGAIGFLYPGAPTAVSRAQGRTPDQVSVLAGPDPGFVQGEVVAEHSNGLVLKAIDATRAVRVDPGTHVWKEFEGLDPSVIEIGDWLDARGTQLDDGTFLVKSGWIWINIGRRDGVVQKPSADGLQIRDSRGDIRMLELSARLEVIDPDTGLPLPRGVLDFTAGMPIGAVGLVLPEDRFRATRIWTAQ